MSYLRHVTLTTGHAARSVRSEVAGPVLDAVPPWLDLALLSDDPAAAPPVPLPVADLAEFTAHVFATACGLVVSIHGADVLSVPPAMPLVTSGVARRSRGAANLRDIMAGAAPGAARVPPMPGAPGWLWGSTRA